jgi:OmpA-OmpF porin, OOP family
MTAAPLSRLLALGLLLASPAASAEDMEGCKDHALFTRMPNMVLTECKASQFDSKSFPVGKLLKQEEGSKTKEAAIEGAFTYLKYEMDTDKEGLTKPSGTQIMRNFEAAVLKAGGSIEGKYPGSCNASNTDSLAAGGCISYGVSMLFKKTGQTRALTNVIEEGRGYEIWIVEAKAMEQDIAANELLEQINKAGFATVYINFESGKSTIKKESEKQVDLIADALKQAKELKLEVAGHTDSQGEGKANLKLSQERARAVVAALTARGVAAARLTAAGYGQDKPVADNRTEEGRARNRRVELVKK